MQRTIEISDINDKSFLKIYHKILGNEFNFHSKSTNLKLFKNNANTSFFDNKIELYMNQQNFKSNSMFQYKLTEDITSLKIVLESNSNEYNLEELFVDLI